jgi:hypothetical protein
MVTLWRRRRRRRRAAAAVGRAGEAKRGQPSSLHA